MPTRLPGAPLVTLSPGRASPVPAVSFLARYSGRTVEAYRHDLRGFFQWATDDGVVVMEASRAHIELFRAWMDDRGLAASTIEPGIRPADPGLGVAAWDVVDIR